MIVGYCERVSQWFGCIAHGPCNSFDEFNCQKAGRDTLKCQTLSHVWVLRLNSDPVTVMQRHKLGCLGLTEAPVTASQRLPLQLNRGYCYEIQERTAQQKLLLRLSKRSH